MVSGVEGRGGGEIFLISCNEMYIRAGYSEACQIVNLLPSAILKLLPYVSLVVSRYVKEGFGPNDSQESVVKYLNDYQKHTKKA